jgi:hypothetical protein
MQQKTEYNYFLMGQTGLFPTQATLFFSASRTDLFLNRKEEKKKEKIS